MARKDAHLVALGLEAAPDGRVLSRDVHARAHFARLADALGAPLADLPWADPGGAEAEAVRRWIREGAPPGRWRLGG